VIESPCRQVCVVDPLTRLCIGCGRSTAEIAAWLGLSAAERRAVMDALPARLDAMTSRGTRSGRAPRARAP
jgi:hypothetical protein